MSALPLLVSYPAKESVVRAMGAELELPRTEIEEAAELLRQGLPPLTRRTWIPFLFGVSPKLIGAMGARSDRYYRRFRLRKRSGGFREIVTPRRYLKTIQRWLLHRVFCHLPISESAHGFVPDRSIFTNAAVHLEGANVIALDLKDFFPTVSYLRVRDLFLEKLPFPESVATQLAGLCTLDGALPQGAPTSPCLANSIFEPTDRRFEALAVEWKVQYSRYADDLAFSGQRRFTPGDVGELKAVVEEAGFQLHEGKTRVLGAGARQTVAGVVVNHAGLPPREVRRRWRAMFHRASKHPHEFLHRAEHLLGVASFINQYDSPLAARYHEVARQVSDARAEGER